MSKTGGGVGTNQYQVRGQAKAASNNKPPTAVCGYPPDQVIKRGNCVWLRAGFDDIWCLKHRQLAPELRQFMGLPACTAQLGPKLQIRALRALPDQVARWTSPELRLRAARCLPPGELGWAIQDPDFQVRRTTAKRLPEGQLEWATKDESWEVRLVAAERMPPSQLEWAIQDRERWVRRAAVWRAPEDKLEWAIGDEDWYVRMVAARRRAATRDKDGDVRHIANERSESTGGRRTNGRRGWWPRR